MDAAGKKKTLLHYLSRGVAMIHLDARREGVTVPPRFRDDPHLRLNLSYRYAIPDFDVSDDRIQATLSFGGVPFQCLVPWASVFGITSHATGDGQVWPEDLPTEVVKSLAEREDGAVKPAAEKQPRRPSLVAIEGSRQPVADKPDDAGPARRPHLRLVR